MAPERTLRTDRLELRPLDLDDVDALWPFVSDPELPKLMTWEAHKDPQETRAFVESTIKTWAEGTGCIWGIRKQGELCGVIGIHDLEYEMRAWRVDRAELGYWLGAPFRGQGLMHEAGREVMRYCFRDLGLHRLTVGCATENEASRRVIEKLGFRFLCENHDYFQRYGRWWNHRAYELVVDEWLALTAQPT